jgi:hypothetical protein
VTDEECLQAFSDIEAALRDLGVGWVVEQVDTLLAVGRVTHVQVSTTTALLDSGRQLTFSEPERASRRGRKAEFAKAIDFSPRERLAILLDAIDQAFGQTVSMQSEADSAVKEILGAAGVELIDPATGDVASLTVDDARMMPIATLSHLVSESSRRDGRCQITSPS